MKYFKAQDGTVYAYEDDADPADPRWFVPGLTPMRDDEIEAHLHPQPTPEDLLAEATAREDQWRVEEMAFIADQLIAMEDGDPAALPGTDAQWRAYRTQVRNWKTGAAGFPDESSRPQRPS